MTKKVDRLADYIPASEAAKILSEKSGRTIDPEYVTRVAKSKKQPIKMRSIGNRFLYLKADIEACIIRQRKTR